MLFWCAKNFLLNDRMVTLFCILPAGFGVKWLQEHNADLNSADKVRRFHLCYFN